jgi:predicted dehydrogenase
MERIKTAVVGCGVISHAYLKSISEKFRIIELAGFCDHTAEKARAAATEYGGKVMTLEEIIADDSIQMVLNLTTVPAHYAIIKTLLEGGKHVYSEKVLTANLSEAAELLEIANRENRVLGVAPDTFLGSAVQTARYVIESGLIGDVTSFSCSLTRDGALMAEAFPFTTKPGGGIGFDVGIYYVTALLSCFGPVSEVTGLMKTVNKDRHHVLIDRMEKEYTLECENLATGVLCFENGVVGTMLFNGNSVSLMPEQPSVIVHGSLGIMYMADPNNFGGDVKILLKGNDTAFTVPQTHGFRTESRGLGAAEMAWSLLKGRKPRANKEMAYHALEVLYGVSQSGITKKFYKLSSTFEKMPPLPRGYLRYDNFISLEESALALSS